MRSSASRTAWGEGQELGSAWDSVPQAIVSVEADFVDGEEIIEFAEPGVPSP